MIRDVDRPDERTRLLLLTLRSALIMALGAIEDALDLPRSLPTRRQRRAAMRPPDRDLTDRVDYQ